MFGIRGEQKSVVKYVLYLQRYKTGAATQNKLRRPSQAMKHDIAANGTQATPTVQTLWASWQAPESQDTHALDKLTN